MDVDYDLKNMGDDDWRMLVDDLKCRRRDEIPGSLEVFAMKAVIRNHKLFTELKSKHFYSGEGRINPLKLLPDVIIQKLLNFLKLSKSNGGALFPNLFEEMHFVKTLLLSANTKEMNLNELTSRCDGIFGSELDEWLECLSEYAPNLTSLTLWEEGKAADTKLGRSPRPLPVDALSLWTKLQVVSMRGFVCSDQTFKQIQKLLPGLVRLEIALASFPAVTMKSGQYLAKMKSLKYLYIRNAQAIIPGGIIAHIAGKIPNLLKLHINSPMDICKFVQEYDQFYRGKKLTLVDAFFFHFKDDLVKTSSGIFTVSESFQGKWPSYLLVENLSFAGSVPHRVFPQNAFENLSRKDLQPTSLTFVKVQVSVMHQIIQELGPSVKILEAYDMVFAHGSEKFNLYQAIEHCPKLENLDIEAERDFDSVDPQHTISPQLFKNVERFHCVWTKSNRKIPAEMNKMLKMFLLGSEFPHKKLHITSIQFEIFEEALSENPSLTNKLQEIVLDMSKDKDSRVDDLMPVALEICKSLILQSPCLQEISLKINFSMGIVRLILEKFSWFDRLIRGIGLRFVIDDAPFLGKQVFLNTDSSSTLEAAFERHMRGVHGDAWEHNRHFLGIRRRD